MIFLNSSVIYACVFLIHFIMVKFPVYCFRALMSFYTIKVIIIKL